jgi:hypothetical protein
MGLCFFEGGGPWRQGRLEIAGIAKRAGEFDDRQQAAFIAVLHAERLRSLTSHTLLL